ncbi:MAG TPA: UDP-3-O-(3-hydroxymyristoyl)glucosamine N-acyltransferase [Vicinamibacterales bacterium]|nr:UDP-3-O-(3-hydroxymyristoyl)glucosamine N-acyltransferase [Vicinamibacterales bacterium]
MTLQQLARQLGCRLEGDGSIEITGLAGIEQAQPGQLTFVANPKYLSALPSTKASAVILDDAAPAPPCAALRTAEPYVAFARALELFVDTPRPQAGVDACTAIGRDVQFGKNVAVGPFVTIGDGVAIGDNTIIYSHAAIGAGTTIGRDCILYSHVAVRERITVGDRVILHNGVVVGSDGYGFARQKDGTHYKIPQIGTIVIEDDVELGANTCVDRPAVGETRIGAGTKIDNLVQIAHGVSVGRRVLLAAQTGVAGSSRIEDDVVFAGQVGVAGHITIGKGTIATAQTGIPNSTDPGSFVSGYPAIRNRDWLKSSAVFKRLPELKKQLQELERRVSELEAELAGGRGEGR